MEFPDYLNDSTTSEETQGDPCFAAFTREMEREYEFFASDMMRSAATQTDETFPDLTRSIATQTEEGDGDYDDDDDDDDEEVTNSHWMSEQPPSNSSRVWWWPDDSFDDEGEQETPDEQGQVDRINGWIPWIETIEE